MEAFLSLRSSTDPFFSKLQFIRPRIYSTIPGKVLFCRAKRDGSFSLRVVPQTLVAAEKEEANAVLTLFLKKQGLSNPAAARTINKSDAFVDHLVSRLHSIHKSRYLVGRELTTLEIRDALIPYLETLLEEYESILVDVVGNFPEPPSKETIEGYVQKSNVENIAASVSSSVPTVESEKLLALARVSDISPNGNLPPHIVYLLELGMKLEAIREVIRKFPAFAYYSLEGKIKPVVEFLMELGVPKSDIPTILSKRPQLCGISLTENLIPTMEFLEELGVDKRQWAKVIYRFPPLLTYSRQKLQTTVDFLYEMGLPAEHVSKVLAHCPKASLYIERRCSFPGPASRFLKPRFPFDRRNCLPYGERKLFESRVRRHGFLMRRRAHCVYAVDDDTGGFSTLDDWGDSNESVENIFSSSEGDNSDGEIILQPINDVDLPTSKEEWLSSDDSLTVAAHRLAMLGRTRKKRKTIDGVLNNVGLVLFSTILLLLVDQCAWKIVRLPLPTFHLMRPFLISVVLTASAGYICVPLFHMLKFYAIVTKKMPNRQYHKKRILMMGGLYFVPIGLLVAEVVLKFSSIEVTGAAAATIAFALIGILDDFLSINNSNGLPGWLKLLLEAAIGTGFSYWSYTADISTPYNKKMVVPLPAPLGLICVRKSYPLLASFCFVSMANGISVTDGIDGLAAGTAALSFIGMSIVVLPICSDLSVFGASMAGACIGFLFQNQYKASIFMGETGALALGGGLAAMASCTGMFFPLLISSGVCVLEALSVIIQVSSFKATKYVWRRGFRLFRVATLHHHLRLCGVREPVIVASAYAVTCLLTLCAAYVGLTSA